MMKVVAIVPAAGRGIRFGGAKNKTLIEVAGEPLLSWTIRAICSSGCAKELIICVRGSERDEVQQIASQHQRKMNISLVEGGEDRQGSVYNALMALEGDADYILVHDAVRPLATPQLISRVLDAAIDCGAATAAVPCTDTVKESDDSGFVRRTLPRDNLYLVQTPQAFRYALLLSAHEHARKIGLRCSDDAGLVEALGGSVKLVLGEPHNIKVTVQNDLLLVELLLNWFISANKAPICECVS